MAPFAWSFSCGTTDPVASATVTGSGDAFSGSLLAETSQDTPEFGPPYPSATAVADGQLELDQTYVLVGGIGPATLSFTIDSPGLHNPIEDDSYGCVFAFNGVSQSCLTDIGASVPTTISEQIEYLVPFSIQFDLSLFSIADTHADVGQSGQVDYSLSGPGLLLALPTPEPSSILLLMSGLTGVLFAARSRVRRI